MTNDTHKFLSSEEAADARIKAIADDIEHAKNRRAEMKDAVESLIAFLQLNKEHIGGFMFCALPPDGMPLIEETNGEAVLTDSDVRCAGLTRLYTDALLHRLRTEFQRGRVGSDPSTRSGVGEAALLAALLGPLSRLDGSEGRANGSADIGGE